MPLAKENKRITKQTDKNNPIEIGTRALKKATELKKQKREC